jgi:hypothetical protein
METSAMQKTQQNPNAHLLRNSADDGVDFAAAAVVDDVGAKDADDEVALLMRNLSHRSTKMFVLTMAKWQTKKTKVVRCNDSDFRTSVRLDPLADDSASIQNDRPQQRNLS